MTKIVSSMFITLDGVVESPNEWHFPYFDDEMAAAIGASLQRSGGVLMGRRLYDEWSQYWPAKTAEDDPFAAFINGKPKLVVSDTLQTAERDDTTILSGDVAAGIADAKDRVDGDLTMSGSATLVRWLLANGLLDELELLVDPIVVGKGARLYDGMERTPLTVRSSTTFASGVQHLVLEPQRD